MGDILNVSGYSSEYAKPVRSVEIEHSFAIGKYEVTVAEFSTFVEDSGYVTLAEQKLGCAAYVPCWRRSGSCLKTLPDASWRNLHFKNFFIIPYFQETTEPVTCISWYDAVAYTEWLSEQTGEHYRLPTEAEWEYAARGGTKTTYWWGNKASPRYANYAGPKNIFGGIYTEPVGSYEANPFGIHDTAGNVSEWVSNRDSDRYGIHRGGSWASSPLLQGGDKFGLSFGATI